VVREPKKIYQVVRESQKIENRCTTRYLNLGGLIYRAMTA